MAFIKENSGYERTILSDLQGAWDVLRESIVENAGFGNWDRALLHVDQAMSWEVVRNLRQMPPLLIIIRNLCIQGNAPSDVIEVIEETREILTEVLEEFHT